MRILALFCVSFLIAFIPYICLAKIVSGEAAEKGACVLYFLAWTFSFGILLLIFT